MAQRRARERPAPAAPKPSRLTRWLIVLGLLAVLAFAVATLPATVLAGHVASYGVQAATFSGSIWSGRAQGLTFRSVPVGNLRWSLRPLALFGGRVAGTLDLDRLDGTVHTGFSVSLGGTSRFEGLAADLPIEALAALPLGLPRGWRGRLTGKFETIEIHERWPTSLRGTLDMDSLVAPPPRNVSIGSYRVSIPDPQAATAEDQLHARVTDKDGPFSFEGRFTLGRDRSFLLEGTLAPRGSTPPELARSLALLGPADASGRRPVSVSGTL
jgi:hypothetical protein